MSSIPDVMKPPTVHFRLPFPTPALSISFKNKIIGSVLGHFSLTEYDIYVKNPSEFNRRIKQIILKRLQDSTTAIK